MLIRPEQLQQHLRGPLAGLYVLHGDEPLLLLEAQDAIRQAARSQGFLIRETYTAETHFQWQTLQFANDAMSLFADKKLIELNIPSGKPGTQGSDALQQLSKNLSTDNLVMISLPVRLDKTAQASKWFQALADAGVVVHVTPVERHQLPAWLKERLAKQGQFVDDATVAFLADRVEGNLLAAHQELQKLALLHPQGELSPEQVRDAVLNVARYDVFQLSEAVLGGDAARFMRMLDGLKAEGEAPTLVAWTLTEEAHILYRVYQGQKQNQPLNQLYRDNRVWGNKQGLVSQALRRLSLPTLREAVTLTAQVDRACKGMSDQDPWHLLSRLGLLLCGVNIPAANLPV